MKAIALYFRNVTKNANENPRKFWKTFKPFLHTKSAMSANDIVLQENDEMIKERTNVAKIFNDYFVTICSSIDARFNSDDFASHLGLASHPSEMLRTLSVIHRTNSLLMKSQSMLPLI